MQFLYAPRMCAMRLLMFAVVSGNTFSVMLLCVFTSVLSSCFLQRCSRLFQIQIQIQVQCVAFCEQVFFVQSACFAEKAPSKRGSYRCDVVDLSVCMIVISFAVMVDNLLRVFLKQGLQSIMLYTYFAGCFDALVQWWGYVFVYCFIYRLF